MVCQELDELCAKFGSLSPHLRIDYIYGMLRMCLPPELRFIGSVVEDLAKKDFNFLREHENRANSQSELQKYSNSDDKMLIEGMAFNLALLHSVNTACANIIFSLLEKNLKTAFHISNSTDKKTVDIILLVLTMAKYHPAFTFHQRTTIAEYYKKVQEQLNNICFKAYDNDRHSPNSASTCYTYSVATATKTHPAVDSHRKAHITSLDVKQDKLHRRHDRKHEFRIQVSWSNGETTETSKTYQELVDFHRKVCEQFPEGVVNCDVISPYLEGSPHKDDDGPDNVDQKVSFYIRHWSDFPRNVRESEYFVQFFKEDNINSNIPSCVIAGSQISSEEKGEDVESMFTPYIPSQSFTVYNSNFSQGEIVGCMPPYYGSSFRQPVYQSPQSSNHCSPVNSRSTSPGETGIDQMASLLNKLQLDKYKNNLDKFSIEQLSVLPVDVLVKEYGLNHDDATRIMAELEGRCSEKPLNHLPNGLVEPCIPGPVSHFSAWRFLHHPPPQPVYTQHPMPFPFPIGVIGKQDTSSSENSSPSRSPIPQLKPQNGTDSSSDNEKVGNSIDSSYMDVRKKARHLSHNREDVNTDTPPQNLPQILENGPVGGSGYQSDPTQGPFARVINSNSYKPQPTHMSMNLHNKTVFNMADSMTGRRIGLAYPYPRCDVQTSTVTSGSNNTGPDWTRRPVIPCPIPFIKSPTVGGNGHSFMCTVTNSTTPLMATNQQSSVNGSIRNSTMTASNSEPILSPNQSVDSQSISGVTNGNPVTCSAPNGHNSLSNTHCNSCGCSGHPGIYQNHMPNQYLPNQMFMPHFVGANGYIHHPFYPNPYPFLNGIHVPPNYQAINHHQHPFTNMHGAQYGYFPPVYLQRRAGVKPHRNTGPTCSNCGSTDHVSSDCKENSMESMSAAFHLKYEPKSNSD